MIIGVCIVAAALMAVGWFSMVYLPARLLHPVRHGPEYWRATEPYLTPADAGLAFEEVDLRSRDGLRLSTWFIPAQGAAKGTLIYLHGIEGSRVTTIGGAAVFAARGFNVLTYDARAAGTSEGEICTYGFFEKDDVSCAVDALVKRADVVPARIAVLGKSLGGAIALQAAAVDRRIRCVVAEAAFTDLMTITNDYQRRLYTLGTGVVHRIAMRVAERRGGFRAREVSPVNAVASCDTPVFFIHGADDPLVRADYSRQLFDAARGPKELWIIPGGGHGSLYKIAGEEYNTRRIEFLERYLS